MFGWVSGKRISSIPGTCSVGPLPCLAQAPATIWRGNGNAAGGRIITGTFRPIPTSYGAPWRRFWPGTRRCALSIMPPWIFWSCPWSYRNPALPATPTGSRCCWRKSSPSNAGLKARCRCCPGSFCPAGNVPRRFWPNNSPAPTPGWLRGWNPAEGPTPCTWMSPAPGPAYSRRSPTVCRSTRSKAYR